MAIEKQDSQIGFTKKRSSQSSEELCFLVPPTLESLGSPKSTTVSIITIDDDEDDETLDSKEKKTDDLMVPPTCKSLGSQQSTTVSIITIDDDEEALDSKDKKTDDLVIPPALNSSISLPSADAIIIMDDDKDKLETLESKQNKKPILGSWWDDDEAFNELSIMVKGLPKPKDTEAESRVGSRFSSSTDLQEKKKVDEGSLSSTHHVSLIDLSDAESVGENTSSNKGNGHVSLDELGVTVEELKSMPWVDNSDKSKINNKKRRLGSWCDDVEVLKEPSNVVKGLPHSYAKGNDVVVSGVESWFSSPHEPKTKKKKVDERSLSSSHHDNNFIGLSEDKIVGESTRSNKGDQHVSLDVLGVSVEDLKSMPWEAFDPTWEIRSKTMDPWLGGFVQDMLSTQ